MVHVAVDDRCQRRRVPGDIQRALGAGRLEARCGPDLLAIVSELPRSVYGSVVVATQPHSKESTPIHVIHFA